MQVTRWSYPLRAERKKTDRYGMIDHAVGKRLALTRSDEKQEQRQGRENPPLSGTIHMNAMNFSEDLHAAKIMIVDDSPIDVKLLKVILRQEGFLHLIVTLDSREAADLYRDHAPDLVLLDLVMPHLDGFAVMAQLTAIESEDYSPILVVTSADGDDIRRQALLTGAQDFVTKPFDHTEVIARIRNMLMVRLLHRRVREQNRRLIRQNEQLRRDVAARIQAETEREALLAQLRISASVFDATQDGVVITDPQRRIIDVNPAFTTMTGYERSEFLGQNPRMLSSGMTPPMVFREMWRMVDEQGWWRGELINRRRNGQVYGELLTITAVKTPGGDVSHYVGVINHVNPLRDDILTGLPSRFAFQDRLAQALETARTDGTQVALLILNLDRFKDVNQALGHAMGDLLLRKAALRLRRCLPAAITLAHLRGDEFGVILPGLSDTIAVEEIVAGLLDSTSQPYDLGEEKVCQTSSIGVALFPADATDLEGLLRGADLAVHAAKVQGGARHHYFMTAMQTAAMERKSLSDDLRLALNEKQFQLYYQPIVDLTDGSIHKAEALIRWPHSSRGLISPAQFIPLAEQTGLIQEIGAWVTEEALVQVAALRRHRADFQMSVNLSPVQLRGRYGSAADLARRLVRTDLSGSALVLEITEGLLLDGDEQIRQRLSDYRALGVQLAIDDFGTGYSSLSYLNKFELDYLKIDQSFVRALVISPKQFALCEAIVVMAHKLGLRVIAEGIETDEQRALLAGMGCDFGQGYLFAKPQPSGPFTASITGINSAGR